MSDISIPEVSCELYVYTKGSDQALKYRVSDFPCKVGRSAECDLQINHPSVSSVHAVINLLPDKSLQINDVNSTNGLFWNYRRINKLTVDRRFKLFFGEVKVYINPDKGIKKAEAADAPVEVSKSLREKFGGCLYRRDGFEFGPYKIEQIYHLAEKGNIAFGDEVLLDGSDEWVPAESVLKEYLDKHNEETNQVLQPKARKIIVSAEQLEEEDEVIKTEVALEPEPAVVKKAKKFTSKNRANFTQALKKQLQEGITCPHCWHQFSVEEFLFISRHQSLLGDPVLGMDAQQRFLPSRFTPEGNALDSEGTSCPDMACPHCHLRIPQTASEMPPLFLSIVGATASGKSYFLTSMIWELRNVLARDFAISFADTDAINNQIINEFEETLFLHADPDELVALRKTELQGELYNQVLIDGMLINLPKPFMFTMTPAEHHPNYDDVRDKLCRTLVLYDNAGEHFEPGMDSVDNPTTQHLLHSDTIFFLFDPTKDVRFRRLIIGSEDPQMDREARVQRQGIILTEMVNRIKKYSGMRTGTKSKKSLVILVSKCDLWQDLLKNPLPSQPWEWDPKLNSCSLNVDMVKTVSYSIRSLLNSICPELISTAESFSGDVIYMPNSALGSSPELNENSGMLGIKTGTIEPIWVSTPMLYFMWQRGLIPAVPESKRKDIDLVPVEYTITGDIAMVRVPDLEKPLQVPLFYMGARLQCPETGVWFELPEYEK